MSAETDATVALEAPAGVADAMRRYLAAVEREAKLRILASQLPERIAEAAREADVAAEAMGLGPRGRRPPPRSRNGAGPRTSGRRFDSRSEAGRIRAALPATADAVAEAVGVTRERAQKQLSAMRSNGHVVRDDGASPPVWALSPAAVIGEADTE